MKYQAELKFSDKKEVYPIIECEYEYSQDIDVTGKPCSKPKGGTVTVLLESKSDPELISWMLAPTNVRSGEITFYGEIDSQKKLKTLSFKEAFCIHYHEKFSGFSGMQTQISFVARVMSLDGVDYSAQWTNF